MGNVEFFEEFAETLAVFSQIDRLGRGSDNADACGLERERKVQRRLPAELHDDADWRSSGSFMLADGKHIFERERLKVKAIAGVVVGRNRLRIAVDHDGFVAIFAQRVAGMATAVIEFNSLPDSVGTRTENDDFFLRRGRSFVFFFVSGIEIRRVAFELGRAGVNALVNRLQAMFLAEVADFFLAAFAIQTPRASEPPVGESHALGLAQHLGRDRFHGMLFQLKLHIVNLFDLIKKPRVNRSHLRDLLDGESLPECILNIAQTLRMRRDQTLRKNFGLDLLGADTLPRIEGANSFLQCFFKSAANGHYFAD